MDRDGLLGLWAKVYSQQPPRNMSTQLLRRAVTYRLQEAAHGGLRPTVRRHLDQLVGIRKHGDEVGGSTTGGAKPGSALPAADLAPGSRLIREWNGRVYQVTVEAADRFVLDGKCYSSLTAIARSITGAAWSGPRFFGLGKARSR